MSNQRGFVGLLSLIVTATVIAFLAVKILTKLYQPVTGPDPVTRGRSFIDQAEEAKRAIEQRSRWE